MVIQLVNIIFILPSRSVLRQCLIELCTYAAKFNTSVGQFPLLSELTEWFITSLFTATFIWMCSIFRHHVNLSDIKVNSHNTLFITIAQI